VKRCANDAELRNAMIEQLAHIAQERLQGADHP